MDPEPRPATDITSWHAHVYYDNATRAHAERLRAQVTAGFRVMMGRWHDLPVGPHPVAMYQIAFDLAAFPALVPFLALNRGRLVILLHPNTDNPHDDHLEHALWMGEVLELDAAMLPVSLAAAGQAREIVVPNT